LLYSHYRLQVIWNCSSIWSGSYTGEGRPAEKMWLEIIAGINNEKKCWNIETVNLVLVYDQYEPIIKLRSRNNYEIQDWCHFHCDQNVVRMMSDIILDEYSAAKGYILVCGWLCSYYRC
jgi:hypothetical protein